MEHINLLGSEDVRRASMNISSAADRMIQAANIIQECADMFLRRLEQIVNEAVNSKGE